MGDVHVVAYHQLCQLPSLPASVEYPLNISLLSVYVLSLLTLIAITCGIIVAIKLSLQNMPAHKSRTDVKGRVMKKCSLLMAVNVIGFTSVLITEGFLRAGFKVEIITLLVLTVTGMSVSKVCNPWFHFVNLIQNMMARKNNGQNVKTNSSTCYSCGTNCY